jgi:hypothetical protein
MEDFNIAIANGFGFLIRVRQVDGCLLYDVFSEPVLHGTIFRDGTSWKSYDRFNQLVIDLIGGLIDQRLCDLE